MKITFDVYLKSRPTGFIINHIELDEDEIIEAAKIKYLENPPTVITQGIFYIDKITIDKIEI
jgi:hypothetical protein